MLKSNNDLLQTMLLYMLKVYHEILQKIHTVHSFMLNFWVPRMYVCCQTEAINIVHYVNRYGEFCLFGCSMSTADTMSQGDDSAGGGTYNTSSVTRV